MTFYIYERRIAFTILIENANLFQNILRSDTDKASLKSKHYTSFIYFNYMHDWKWVLKTELLLNNLKILRLIKIIISLE